MGIDMDLVVSDVGENFKCSICTDLIHNAVTLKNCEHTFCNDCIQGVVLRGVLRCPDCRSEFASPDDLCKPFRIVRQILAGIRINCPRDECNEQMGYEQYDAHLLTHVIQTCSYCATEYQKSDEGDHLSNCFNYVKLQKLQLESDLATVKLQLLKINAERSKDSHSPIIKENISHI